MKRSRRPLIRRIVRWLLAAEAVEVAVEAAERLAGREAPCADAKGRGTVKQLFGPKATAVFRASLAGAVLALVVVLVVIDLAPRMPFVTGVNSFIRQDVPFSHEHHAGEIGIDCRFCHQSAARSSFAGIPPTRTCMKCHRVLFADAPMLAPVRDSFRSGRPLAWNRVYKLPDFVYFDHGVHVTAGSVSCRTCHGALERMPWVRRVDAFFMNRCIGCHRSSSTGARGAAADAAAARALTECSTCHR